jgi:ABC-type glycerol-3-phosphate transport system permease component
MMMMLSGSFQNVQFLLKQPPDIIPKRVTLWNYKALLEEKPVGTWILNTLWIGGATCVLAVFVTMFAAYGILLAVKPVRILAITLCFLYITISKGTLLIPTYVVMGRLRLQSQVGLVLSTTLMPMGTLIAYAYLNQLPKELFESSEIDGANKLQVFIRLVLPLCRPIMGLLLIFKGIEILSDYAWQHLLLQEERTKTYIVGLVSAMQNVGYAGMARKDPIGPSLAASTLMLIPMVAIVLIFQKQLVRGMLEGGIK